MDYDIAIIGASLAGSTAAHLLGRAGLRVALIDKASFPRRKPCGEGLARAGLSIIKRVGLAAALANTPHQSFRGYRLSAGKKSCVLATPQSGGVTLQREHFDSAILRAALNHPTVTPFLAEHVQSIDPSGQIELSRETISARFIILASGANSSLVRALALPVRSFGHQRTGITATFSGSFNGPADLVHIAILPNCEIYATPLPDNQLNINILAPYPSVSNIRKQLLAPATLRQIAEPLGFHGTMTLAPLGRAPIGNRARKASLLNTLLIGDAAEEFDPIGGMGMTHALRSAELASESLISIFQETHSQQAAFSSYERSRAESARTMRFFTKLSYRTLRGAIAVPLLLDLATSSVGKIMSNHFSYQGT